MQAVKKGKDRQTVHARIRRHHTFEEMAHDPEIGLTLEELTASTPTVGRSAAQVDEYLTQELSPLLKDLKPIIPEEAQEI